MVLQMRCGGYKAEFRPFGLDLERLLAHNEPSPAATATRSPTDGFANRMMAWRRSWFAHLRWLRGKGTP